jgi:hypothetical protein
MMGVLRRSRATVNSHESNTEVSQKCKCIIAPPTNTHRCQSILSVGTIIQT